MFHASLSCKCCACWLPPLRENITSRDCLWTQEHTADLKQRIEAQFSELHQFLYQEEKLLQVKLKTEERRELIRLDEHKALLSVEISRLRRAMNDIEDKLSEQDPYTLLRVSEWTATRSHSQIFAAPNTFISNSRWWWLESKLECVMRLAMCVQRVKLVCDTVGSCSGVESPAVSDSLCKRPFKDRQCYLHNTK